MSSDAAKELISLQVKSLNTLHKKIVHTCWAKCVSRPREQDLHMGETACVDRCVPKYIEAHQLVGKELAETRGAAPMFP
jgi:mitochondrial import inner membrane translocase subunit TIM10